VNIARVTTETSSNDLDASRAFSCLRGQIDRLSVGFSLRTPLLTSNAEKEVEHVNSVGRSVERALEKIENGDSAVTLTAQRTSTPVASSEGGSSTATASDSFDLIVSRIAGLMREDDENSEESRPTQHALTLAMHILSAARPLLVGGFPRASVAATSEGGIHVYWKRPNRIVQMSAPATDATPGFIYHDDGNSHGTDRGLSAEALAHWICWLGDA